MAEGVSIGQLCVLLRGRNAGRKVVVVDFEKGNFALVDGLRVKRKKRNIRHLLPVQERIEIKRGASHEEIVERLK
jgi:large subunit ribosomal protein L14e